MKPPGRKDLTKLVAIAVVMLAIFGVYIKVEFASRSANADNRHALAWISTAQDSANLLLHAPCLAVVHVAA
jgi:NO-binding membrane sensor protein with MHYT domain